MYQKTTTGVVVDKKESMIDVKYTLHYTLPISS